MRMHGRSLITQTRLHTCTRGACQSLHHREIMVPCVRANAHLSQWPRAHGLLMNRGLRGFGRLHASGLQQIRCERDAFWRTTATSTCSTRHASCVTATWTRHHPRGGRSFPRRHIVTGTLTLVKSSITFTALARGPSAKLFAGCLTRSGRSISGAGPPGCGWGGCCRGCRVHGHGWVDTAAAHRL